jgi:hypothetical protein
MISLDIDLSLGYRVSQQEVVTMNIVKIYELPPAEKDCLAHLENEIGRQAILMPRHQLMKASILKWDIPYKND